MVRDKPGRRRPALNRDRRPPRSETPARRPAVDRDLERLMAEALKLAPQARAKLVNSLIDSIDQHVDPDAAAAWAVEIARRIRKSDAGKTRPIPWAEARRMIRGE